MDKKTQAANRITEGVIWKQIMYLFFPILLGTFFQQFYNTVDMVIVGRFVGTEALASVGGSSALIINFVVGFFTGLGGGASVIISQYYGAKIEKKLNDSIHTAYAFAIAGSVLITILGIMVSPWLLEIMNTPEELLVDSAAYLRIYFGGIIFVFIYNIGSGILRALGDTRRPLIYLIVCCFINIVLDLVTIIVFHMGIAGAALATVIAQGVSAVLVTIALMRSKDIYKLELRKIRFHKRILLSELYIGLPTGIQSTTYSLSNMILQTTVNSFGTVVTAAWATLGKLDAIVWMISGAFGIAVTTFVGQNYGAGKYTRLHKGIKVALGLDFFVSVFLGIFLITFRIPLFKIFTTDAGVIENGAFMIEQLAPFYWMFVFIEILSSALRGISDVIIPTMINLSGVCLLRLAWIFLVIPKYPTMKTVIMNYPVTWVATSVLFVIYYAYRMKKQNWQQTM